MLKRVKHDSKHVSLNYFSSLKLLKKYLHVARCSPGVAMHFKTIFDSCTSVNMKATFDNTVSILVQAYLNDELAHKTCSACAVGNIVAAAIGTKPKRTPITNMIEFDNCEFANGVPAMAGWYIPMKDLDDTNELIQATGYTAEQLFDIEAAFENAPGNPIDAVDGIKRGQCTDPEWMFNGLMAVVEVLAEIHGVDLAQKESAKQLFVKG